MLFSTNDVSDAIVAIVGHVGQGVENHTGRLNDHEVVDQSILKLHVAANEVVHDGDTLARRAKSKGGIFVALHASVATETVVPRRSTGTLSLLHHRRRAVAVVEVAPSTKGSRRQL